MPNTNAASPTCFVFTLTEMMSRPDGRFPLSRSDVNALSYTTKRVLALCEFLPPDLDQVIFLDGSRLVVDVVQTTSVPANTNSSDVHTICTDALATLNRTAAEIQHNARRTSPLPSSIVAPNKGALTLLRRLASDGTDALPAVTLISQGSVQSLPVLAPADFTSAANEVTQRKTGTFRIVGLIRGDRNCAHRLVLAGGLHIELPSTSTWAWREIHDLLDYESTMVGTLTRESEGGMWSVSEDSHVERQPPLL